jgi:hypothetical protein
MKLMSFAEFLALREGLLLPDRPRAPGVPRMNTLPATQAHLRRYAPRKTPQPTPKSGERPWRLAVAG